MTSNIHFTTKQYAISNLTQESVQKLPQSLICSMCRNVLRNPTQCQLCDNIWCDNCYQTTYSIGNTCPSQCVGSQSELLKDMGDKNSTKTSYGQKLVSKLAKLKFKCCNFTLGCTDTISYKNLEMHLKECLYQIQTCNLVECTKQFLLKDIKLHEQHCQYRKQYCNICSSEHDMKSECQDVHKCEECLQFYLKNKNDHRCIPSLSEGLLTLNQKLESRNSLLEAELKLKDSQIQHLNNAYECLSAKLNRFENIFKMIPGYLTNNNSHEQVVGKSLHKVHDVPNSNFSLARKYTTTLDDSDNYYSCESDDEHVEDSKSDLKLSKFAVENGEETPTSTASSENGEIEFPKYTSDRYTLCPSLFQDKFKEFVRLWDMSLWKKQVSKYNTDIYTADLHDNYHGVMSVGEFPFSIPEILLFIQEDKVYEESSPMIEKMELVEKFTEADIAFYLKVKGMLMVAGRDFVGVSHTVTKPNGDQAIFLYSIDHPDSPESDSKIVRGELYVGGWHFEYVSPNVTKCYNLAVNDYKGNIPKFVLNSGATMNASTFKNIIDMMTKAKQNGTLGGEKEFESKFGYQLKEGKRC